MQEIKLCKSIRITAGPSNKTRMFAFVQTQARTPLYSPFVYFDRHQHYKRTKGKNRLKKIIKKEQISSKTTSKNNRHAKSSKDVVLIV